MKESNFRKQNYNFVGLHTKLEGELKFSGDTIIHGEVKGTIIIQDEGSLVFERTACFEGTIYCKHLEVFGEVKGTVKASGTLSIRSSASVSGNIQANKLVVYPGAILNVESHTEDFEPEASSKQPSL
tara:strand:+ start:169 stop:549 length:381 start_codon:yes stop_codon:yes gene_type:complete